EGEAGEPRDPLLSGSRVVEEDPSVLLEIAVEQDAEQPAFTVGEDIEPAEEEVLTAFRVDPSQTAGAFDDVGATLRIEVQRHRFVHSVGDDRPRQSILLRRIATGGQARPIATAAEIGRASCRGRGWTPGL